MKALENNIERLLINSSFDELTPEDREYVLQYLSEDEFRSFQRVVLSAKFPNSPERLMPAALGPELKKKFREHHRKNRRGIFLLPPGNARIMAVSIAAAVLLLVVFILFAYQSNKSVSNPVGPSSQLVQRGRQGTLKSKIISKREENPSATPANHLETQTQAGLNRSTLISGNAEVTATPSLEEGQKLLCYDIHFSLYPTKDAPMGAMDDEIPCLYTGFDLDQSGKGKE
jgi:hypothetical protein